MKILLYFLHRKPTVLQKLSDLIRMFIWEKPSTSQNPIPVNKPFVTLQYELLLDLSAIHFMFAIY